MMADAVERVFLKEGSVLVTNARFQVGAQTFAMNAVSSVSYQRRGADLVGSTLFITIGVVIFVFGLVGALVSWRTGGGFVALFFGLILVLIGASMRKSRKDSFIVALRTSSGEVPALESPDQAYIERVVLALNEALVSRG